MYQVKAFEKREIGSRYKKVYDKCFESERDARLVAEELIRRISDVYGFSYVDILDEDGYVIDTLRDYDSDSNPNLDEFDEEEYLRKMRG